MIKKIKNFINNRRRKNISQIQPTANPPTPAFYDINPDALQSVTETVTELIESDVPSYFKKSTHNDTHNIHNSYNHHDSNHNHNHHSHNTNDSSTHDSSCGGYDSSDSSSGCDSSSSSGDSGGSSCGCD